MNGVNSGSSKTFEQLLMALIEEVEHRHKGDAAMRAMAREVRERYGLLKGIFDRLQSMIGSLRFLVKYLLFDLEATRRERDKSQANEGPPSEHDDLNDPRM